MKKFAMMACFLMALALASSAGAVESGWWWNPNEPGRGMAIEVQGDTIFLALYLYDQETGESMWLSSGGKTEGGTTYFGVLLRYRDGQCLGCPYVAPGPAEDYGTITLNFTSDTTATMTCSKAPGVTHQIERFRFGSSDPPSPPPAQDSDQKTKTLMLKGHWWLSYTIISTFADDYDLWSLQQSTTDGTWFLGGEDKYGGLVVGGYNEEYGDWSILDPGSIIDKFYVFTTDGQTITGGCYYQIVCPPAIGQNATPCLAIRRARRTPWLGINSCLRKNGNSRRSMRLARPRPMTSRPRSLTHITA